MDAETWCVVMLHFFDIDGSIFVNDHGQLPVVVMVEAHFEVIWVPCGDHWCYYI